MLTHLNTSIDEFSALVECIYQGATDVNVWPEISKKICDWLGAKTCVIFTPQFPADQGGFAIKHQFDGMLELYDAKYNAHNIWEIRAYERGLLTTGSVMRDQDLVTDQEFLDSIFYKEYFSHINLGRMIAGIVFDPRDNDGKAVVCACHKPFDAPFSTNEAEKLKLLMPHLSRALGVMFKLRDAEFKVANSMRALNCLSRGVLLFNNLGQVTFANTYAKKLLSQHDGLMLQECNDVETWSLVAKNAADNTMLEAAIFEAIKPEMLSTRHFSKSLIIARTSGKPSYVLSFSTLGERNEFSQLIATTCAIAFIHDASQPLALKPTLLAKVYGFTISELKIAELLVNGHESNEVANLLEVSLNTIKTHIKNIHTKTNTNSRAKLVKLLISLDMH